jgi:hypothetical protein
MGDWPLFLFISEQGHIGYINQVMSTYRKHIGGVWSSNNNFFKIREHINALDKYNNYYHYRFAKIIKKAKVSRIAYAILEDYKKIHNMRSIKDQDQAILRAWQLWSKEVPQIISLKNNIIGYIYFALLFYLCQ